MWSPCPTVSADLTSAVAHSRAGSMLIHQENHLITKGSLLIVIVKATILSKDVFYTGHGREIVF